MHATASVSVGCDANTASVHQPPQVRVSADRRPRAGLAGVVVEVSADRLVERGCEFLVSDVAKP
jgi:hypothetical protein